MSAPYQVEFRPEAVSDFDRLAPDVRERILDRVRWLAAHFDEVTPEPLRLTNHLIGHRREIYR